MKVGIRADFARKRAVISCETKDGKPIHRKADFQKLEKIHDEIRKQLETSWYGGEHGRAEQHAFLLELGEAAD
jgi:hypothetical protein